jgi:hypothetical protein
LEELSIHSTAAEGMRTIIDSLDVGSVPWRANLGDGSVTAPPPETSLA